MWAVGKVVAWAEAAYLLSQQYCKQFRIYPNYSSSSVTPKTQNSLYLSSYSLHWSGSRYRAPRYYVGEGIKKNMKKRKLTVKISYESNRLGEKYLSDAYEKLIPVKTYSIDLAKGNKIFNPEFFLQRRKTLS